MATYIEPKEYFPKKYRDELKKAGATKKKTASKAKKTTKKK